jgi:hypothetical protein
VASRLAPQEEAYKRLCDDAASLLRRAMADTSDAKALAPLQSEGTGLWKCEQQLTPVFAKWKKTLSAAQRKTLLARCSHENSLVSYLISLNQPTHPPTFALSATQTFDGLWERD